MTYLLALDQGTSSSRSIVFDATGQVVAVAQQELPQIYPRPGWVEHDPLAIWRTQIDTARDVLAQAGLTARDLHAVGITNQRETTVVWNRATGLPIHHAIVWQDRRSEPLCARLRERGLAPVIQARTGLLIDAYFSATKVAWILENVPGARAKAEKGQLAFGTIDTWLIWKLTSGHHVHVTDPSNASRTMLYNIHTGEWDRDLLKLFRIPASMLPEVRSSCEVYGEISTSLGLQGVPVAGVAGDQQSALFGQMCIKPGLGKNTYGTGCFVLENIGAKPVTSKQRLLTTVAWQIGKKREYALEGSVFIGGAVVQWLRDGLQLVRSAQEVDMLAGSVADSGGVFVVPAFTGLGAPHWDAYARGMIIGLTRDTSAAHIARASLEGVAFQVADLLDAMHADTGKKLTELRVDGGASRSEPMMQFQADLLGVPVVRPAVIETTALGAAYLAGLAVGFWKDVASIATQWKIEKTFEPQMPKARVAELRGRWRDALSRAGNWEPKEKAARGKSRRR